MRKQKLARFLRAFRIGVLLLVLVISTFTTFQTASAQLPAGHWEYFIPGGTDQLFQILQDIDNDPDLGNAFGFPGDTCSPPAECNEMHNVTTVSVASDNVTLYYDHWENGYSTGETGDETYIANEGDVLTFESGDIIVPRAAVDTCASTNPNGTTSVCYDGRDRIYVVGGSVSIAQAFWPEVTGTVFANAWEIYPISALQSNYVISVGEDLAGPPLNYTDFTETFMIVQATEDNTNVQINDPNNGLFNVPLNRGEVTELFHIYAGTTIQASAPVQTQYIVGQPNTGTASDSRSYTAVPSVLWATSYYSPVPSFGGASNTDVFIYNPTGSTLAINFEDSIGSGTFFIPANTTRSYEDLAGRFVPTNSALFLEATDGVTNFWAVGSANTENANYNYGFTFIPFPLLTDEYFIAWAPGTTNISDNGSPVFVTPTQDNTTINVDYSPTDGVVDATFTLNRIAVQRFFDPDNDNTGMHIWADNPIAAVWGEDAAAAASGNPYIDAGYTILPLTIDPPDPPATPTSPPSGPGNPGNPGGGGSRPAGFIPVTGFAPDRITDLGSLPVTKYNTSNDVTLEIPVLKLKMPVVGIPMKDNTWDVNWLLNQAGWLEGSAFPGFSGNSVLTSHITLSYGQPGPFANLHKLKTGDFVFIHAFGNRYIYEVRMVNELYPTDPSILGHKDKSWLTLVTCAEYSEEAETYLKRLVVKAALVQAKPQRWWSSWP